MVVPEFFTTDKTDADTENLQITTFKLTTKKNDNTNTSQ